MNDDDNALLAQDHAIAESIRPDIFELERIMSIRKSQCNDAMDLLMQEKIHGYLDLLGHTIKAARAIIEYAKSNQ